MHLRESWCVIIVISLCCALRLRVRVAGKDYFTDKAPLASLEQLKVIKEIVRMTGRKYMVYYSERIHVEAAIFVRQLIQQGAIERLFTSTASGCSGRESQRDAQTVSF